jgi:hypothetical protein
MDLDQRMAWATNWAWLGVAGHAEVDGHHGGEARDGAV